MRRSLGTRRVCALCRRRPDQRLATHAFSPRLAQPGALQTQAVISTRFFTGSAPARSTDTSRCTTSTTTTASDDAPRTHYDFFPKTLGAGPPPRGSFAIDTRALRREFLALQSQAHPDLHPSHLKSRAEATSARINEAFRTLEDPLARACYILHTFCGRDVAGDETAKVDDSELLMLVLETREAIEDAEAEEDLEPVHVENEERIGECEDRLGTLFARLGGREEGGASSEQVVEAAVREVVRLRYWVNIRESIRNWERGKPVVLEH